MMLHTNTYTQKHRRPTVQIASNHATQSLGSARQTPGMGAIATTVPIINRFLQEALLICLHGVGETPQCQVLVDDGVFSSSESTTIPVCRERERERERETERKSDLCVCAFVVVQKATAQQSTPGSHSPRIILGHLWRPPQKQLPLKVML